MVDTEVGFRAAAVRESIQLLGNHPTLGKSVLTVLGASLVVPSKSCRAVYTEKNWFFKELYFYQAMSLGGRKQTNILNRNI